MAALWSVHRSVPWLSQKKEVGMSRQLCVRLLCLILLVSWVPAVFAQSQATTGVIEGTVTDETGAVLPGATVTLRNTGTHYETVVTNRYAGRFRACVVPLRH